MYNTKKECSGNPHCIAIAYRALALSRRRFEPEKYTFISSPANRAFSPCVILLFAQYACYVRARKFAHLLQRCLIFRTTLRTIKN
jgi:hypothetical protein